LDKLSRTCYGELTPNVSLKSSVLSFEMAAEAGWRWR